VSGRKRHLLVDTQGLVLAVVVHAGNIQDRDGAKQVLEKYQPHAVRLKRVWADAGYKGELEQWTKTTCDWELEIVYRTEPGFHVLPRRWVVERTFAWLGRYRRLSKDYEYLTDVSETIIDVAMIHLMVRRLERHKAIY